MSARAEIAAAATLVDDVHVTAEYRQTLKPGEGFVKWEGQARDDSSLGWIDTWQVWIAIPQHVGKGEKWIAEHLPALVAAIDAEMVVTAAVPRDLLLGTTSTNGLIIEGTRESA